MDSERCVIVCPACNSKAAIPPEKLNAKVKCRKCSAIFRAGSTPSGSASNPRSKPEISDSPSKVRVPKKAERPHRESISPVPDIPDQSTSSRGFLLVSCIGIAIVTAALGAVWYFNFSSHAKSEVANQYASRAIANAEEWLAGNSQLDGSSIERRLTDALNDEFTTVKPSVISMRDRVREKQGQLAEQDRVEANRKRGKAVIKSAEALFEAGKEQEGLDELKTHILKFKEDVIPEVRQFLSDAEIAVSEKITLDTLVAMSDDDFSKATEGGLIANDQLSNPVLLKLRGQTIAKVIDRAASRREELRVEREEKEESARFAAEQKRVDELLAAAERERLETERIRKEAEETAKREEEERRPIQVDNLEQMLEIHESPAEYVGKRVIIGPDTNGFSMAYMNLLGTNRLKEQDAYLFRWTFERRRAGKEEFGSSLLQDDVLNYLITTEQYVELSAWVDQYRERRVNLEFEIFERVVRENERSETYFIAEAKITKP